MMSNRQSHHAGASLPFRILLALMTLVIALSALPLASISAQEATTEAPPPIGSEVIVVLENGEDPAAAARAMGVEIEHVYRHVFNGFAGTVRSAPPETVAAARMRRAPKEISPDGPVSIEAQEIPLGVSRTGIPKNPDGQHLAVGTVDADIAILDTGIADLADLNLAGGHSCHGGSFNDDNGHGTHVAGTAAAIDNDEGVVGVAPGARLWAVKVLDSSGGGSFSDVICGLDWVLGNAGTIDVVNLSLSGAGNRGDCKSPALHVAVCAVVNAGIPVVVAAGNQGVNADRRVPASYHEVITVSGITDSDGKPGGLGPKPCFGPHDDTFLSFSNFGASVDIAAPGGCIVSYSPNGGLDTASGTSAASPHVAGAVAHFMAANPGTNAEQARAWLLTQASRSQAADGMSGDPDSQQSQSRKLKKKIKKTKKKIKKANSKKKKRKLRKKLRKLKRQRGSVGHLEPVLWLDSLPQR